MKMFIFLFNFYWTGISLYKACFKNFQKELESLQDKGDEFKEISFANTNAEEPSLQVKEVDTELTNESKN